MTFGDKQAELRKRAGMTQEQLAEGCGISIWTLRGYEQNRREPGWQGAIKIARALGVTVEAFADCTSVHDEADQGSAEAPGRGRRRQHRRAHLATVGRCANRPSSRGPTRRA